jgi:hypothetical protein
MTVHVDWAWGIAFAIRCRSFNFGSKDVVRADLHEEAIEFLTNFHEVGDSTGIY